MAVLPGILLAASVGLQVVGQLREGQRVASVESYNARVAEANAQAVKTSAVYEQETLKTKNTFEQETLKKQSELEKSQISRTKKQALSEQQAKYAKAGVRIDEGSPLEVMADTAAQYELDLMANRYNLGIGLEKGRYETEAELGRIGYGSAVKQAQLNAEAQYRRRIGKAAKTASYLKAGSTLLTGGYQVGQQGKVKK